MSWTDPRKRAEPARIGEETVTPGLPGSEAPAVDEMGAKELDDVIA